MSNPTEKSNIAIRYDKDFNAFESAVESIGRITASIRIKHAAGRYPAHQREAVDELLRRLDADDRLFLINVPGGPGGASFETLLIDRGKHGMDGRNLPHADGRELAAVLVIRNQARDDLGSNWHKLSKDEQKARKRP